MITEFRGKYRFLSNFWGVTVHLDGMDYRSVEHAYQAAKTIIPAERQMVRNAGSPGNAKRAGRRVTLRHDWDEVMMNIMEGLIRGKFRNPQLREMLLATGTQELVEGNRWHDNFWGDCSCDRCKDVLGSNYLGGILMRVRRECRR